MVTLPDLLYVALFAVALPLWDYLVFWPAFHRRLQADPARGVLRTGIVGTFFTLVVAVFGSLWPAIALHALLDLGQGVIAWLALREGQATDAA